MEGNATREKPKVTFFQRKPRPSFSFSLEYVFEDIRARLINNIEAEVIICENFNDGFNTKFKNIWEAYKRQSSNVNHITGEVHFLNLLMAKERNLLTILDCGMMFRKQGISKIIVQWLYLKLPVKKAKLVTAISQETKSQIIKYTGCAQEKIKVIPVAIDPLYQPRPRQFNDQTPRILQIGVGPNKNIFNLIEAISGLNCHLSIIGRLTDAHLEALAKHQINYSNAYNLSQDELLSQYQHCDILSFVSTYEGFGMPIIEANSVERVVITSNTSSMPEVAGDAACLVDPFDVNDIRNGLQKLIADADYRNSLIENGRKNKLRFDGDIIANQYLDLYKTMQEQINKKRSRKN